MKILSVIASADVGGAEVHVEHVVTSVEGSHHVVTLGDGPMVRKWRAAGADVYVLPTPEKIPLGVKGEMERIVRAVEPHVVHAHTPKANFLMALCRPLAPFVMTIHGSHRQFVTSRRLPATWYKWADLWASMRAAYVVAVCEADRRELIASGFARAKVRLIPNGVPDPGVYDEISRRPFEPRDVAWIGRLSVEKRPELMIEIARLIATHPMVRRVRMVGDGNLRDLLRAASLPKLVMEPHLSSMRDLWLESNVLVNTSLSEGASLSVIEGLAAGMPVVASAVGGNPEIVANAGFTVADASTPSETAGTFTAIIKHLLEDESHWGEISALARRRYEERYHLRQMAAGLEDLYRTVMLASGIS